MPVTRRMKVDLPQPGWRKQPRGGVCKVWDAWHPPKGSSAERACSTRCTQAIAAASQWGAPTTVQRSRDERQPPHRQPATAHNMHTRSRQRARMRTRVGGQADHDTLLVVSGAHHHSAAHAGAALQGWSRCRAEAHERVLKGVHSAPKPLAWAMGLAARSSGYPASWRQRPWQLSCQEPRCNRREILSAQFLKHRHHNPCASTLDAHRGDGPAGVSDQWGTSERVGHSYKVNTHTIKHSRRQRMPLACALLQIGLTWGRRRADWPAS